MEVRIQDLMRELADQYKFECWTTMGDNFFLVGKFVGVNKKYNRPVMIHGRGDGSYKVYTGNAGKSSIFAKECRR